MAWRRVPPCWSPPVISTAYHDEADAPDVRIAAEDAKVFDTQEIEPGVMLDFDAEGRAIGVEILSVRARSTGVRIAA